MKGRFSGLFLCITSNLSLISSISLREDNKAVWAKKEGCSMSNLHNITPHFKHPDYYMLNAMYSWAHEFFESPNNASALSEFAIFLKPWE
jgi:hypothetical protein